MATPAYFRHEAALRHIIPGHPERPERILALEAALAERDWLGWEVVEAPEATREQLLGVHPETHISAIEELCASGGGWIDGDTACIPATWEAALRGAGGACAAVDALLTEGRPSAFSAMRPPGHHAEPTQAMGFCFFDSVAVAAQWALDEHGLDRVAIFDWDVHHGNGTNEIFRQSDRVLFASAHQSPLYPGTGPVTDAGTGKGEGFTLNLPVPGGAGDDVFKSITAHVLVPVLEGFRPQLILVSAGFDAHVLDPLASCRVTEAGYVGMTATLRRAADALGAPLGMVLEGGYSTEALARSACALMPVLAGEDPGPADPAQVDPLATRYRDLFARYWPELG